MHESAPQGPPSAETIERGHESSIIGLRGFIIFLGILVATGVVVCLAMWGMMVGIQTITERKDPTISPLAEAQQIKVPEPWLQPSKAQGTTPASESQDLAKLRASEDEVLNSYAIDSKTGGVRIPIDRAMGIVAARAGAPASQPSGGAR